MDSLEKTCSKLKNTFDIKEPRIGHFNRFEKKLKSKKKKPITYKYIVVAASILMLFGLVFKIGQFKQGIELAEISPKMGETQDYFTTAIHDELTKVNKVKNKENAQIIDDAFVQITQLETNYVKLTIELKNSNNSKQIIFAMINNYQQRIDVLQNLLSDLDDFEQLKNRDNENNTI